MPPPPNHRTTLTTLLLTLRQLKAVAVPNRTCADPEPQSTTRDAAAHSLRQADEPPGLGGLPALG